MNEVLLITGCVNPNKDAIFLTVRDSNQRLNQYLETIKWALTNTNFGTVVFCENSKCDYDFMGYARKISQNKTFEYITFQGNTKNSNILGKGYGEGEIIEYAYNNSSFLKNTKYFWKITGRLTVKNINRLLKKSKQKNYFLNSLDINEALDTKLYKISTSDYKKYLMNSYKKVNDKVNIPIEKIYFEQIKQNRIKYYCFRRYPIIRGISGSTGIQYRVSGVKRNLYNILCLLNLYNIKFIYHMYQFINKIKKQII